MKLVDSFLATTPLTIGLKQHRTLKAQHKIAKLYYAFFNISLLLLLPLLSTSADNNSSGVKVQQQSSEHDVGLSRNSNPAASFAPRKPRGRRSGDGRGERRGWLCLPVSFPFSHSQERCVKGLPHLIREPRAVGGLFETRGDLFCHFCFCASLLVAPLAADAPSSSPPMCALAWSAIRENSLQRGTALCVQQRGWRSLVRG